MGKGPAQSPGLKSFAMSSTLPAARVTQPLWHAEGALKVTAGAQGRCRTAE